MSRIIQFTTTENDLLTLGWHEAIMTSRIDECSVKTDDVVFLDALTSKADGVLTDIVQKSIDALENCSSFYERYHVEPDLDRDSPEFLNLIYPMNQDSETTRRRFRTAIDLLKQKLRQAK